MALSQNTRILDYLKSGKKLTPITALEKFGCFRLSVNLRMLMQQGHAIITKNVTRNGKTFAEYSLSGLSMITPSVSTRQKFYHYE